MWGRPRIGVLGRLSRLTLRGPSRKLAPQRPPGKKARFDIPMTREFTVDQQYDETYRFLCSLDRFGILLGLENITQLLDRLGNPQLAFPAVHVAGSNGKGSTCSFISNVLQEAGLKTALYTSPHLNDFRERIRFDGNMVSKEAVIRSTQKVREVHDPARTTFFEFTTAVAFDCIAQARPDIAVIEVGLGGRLDATNTLRPLLTVITDIAREHEDYLGIGIRAVATEKAGIIKPGVPLVTGATRGDARDVISKKAASLGAPIRLYGKDFRGVHTALKRFTYSSESMVLEEIALGMAGSHQTKNASLACAAIDELRKAGHHIPDSAIRDGLRKTIFPGRFEVLRQSPDVVIDGAHTPEAMRLLKSTFRQHYPAIRPLLMLGALKEKNYRLMLETIAPIAKEVVCVTPQGDRALPAEDLATAVRALGLNAAAVDGITEGFRLLLGKAAPEDVILATGSLYMIGPVRAACRNE